MSAGTALAAVATRVRVDEAEAIDALGIGANRAENLRVLIRFGLDNPDMVRSWYAGVTEVQT